MSDMRSIFSLISFFHSKEFQKWKVGSDIGEMSVRPSVPPSKLVLTVGFSKLFFCWKGTTSNTYLLYFLSVYPFVQTDGQKDKIVKCRSNSPIFKILFLLARYDIRYLSFVHFVRPSVRTPPPPLQN